MKTNSYKSRDQLQLIDSHCHLDMEQYKRDLDEVLARARSEGVNTVVTIGIDYLSSQAALELADRYPAVHATVGIHPHDAESASDQDLHALAELASSPKIVAWGEIGLDYAKKYSPAESQRQVFARQLALARDLNLPVIIHDRDAHRDTLEILKRHGPYPAGGVMHCFSGDIALAREIRELGFFLSIPGIVTFKNARQLQQVAAEIPLEAMLLETDGPFLAPVPYRGKRNEPAFLVHTARKVAELREIPVEEVARATTANTRRLFRLAEVCNER